MTYRAFILSSLVGALSLTSLQAIEPLTASSGSMTEQQAKRIIDKTDDNKDGKLQPNESKRNWKK